jgi:hypothetical protein
MWAFKDTVFYPWRPKRHRRKGRAPNVKSKQAEPALASADGIRESVENKRTEGVPQTVAPTFFAKLRNAIEYYRKLITPSPGPASRSYEPRPVKRKEVELKRGSGGRVSALAISMCFGLLVSCGIVIAALFTQVREMQADIALLKLRLAGVDSHLSRLEVTAQQKIIKEAKLAEAPPPSPPRPVQISLSNDDIKLIRASIKVLPSQPGAQSKVQLGQEVSAISTVPVPGSVVGQIPKLRGARFLVDDNGAIIIIAEGSNRADVVIEPQ